MRPSGRPADPKEHYTSKYLDARTSRCSSSAMASPMDGSVLSNLRLLRRPVAEKRDHRGARRRRQRGRTGRPRRPCSCSPTISSRASRGRCWSSRVSAKIKLDPGRSGHGRHCRCRLGAAVSGAESRAGVRARRGGDSGRPVRGSLEANGDDSRSFGASAPALSAGPVEVQLIARTRNDRAPGASFSGSDSLVCSPPWMLLAP